jgi:hypothetical protein
VGERELGKLRLTVVQSRNRRHLLDAVVTQETHEIARKLHTQGPHSLLSSYLCAIMLNSSPPVSIVPPQIPLSMYVCSCGLS